MTDDELTHILHNAFYSFGVITGILKSLPKSDDYNYLSEFIELRLEEVEDLLVRGSKALRSENKPIYINVCGPAGGGGTTVGKPEQWDDTA